MPLRDVLGQPHAVETVRRGLLRGKLHHALLFAGPDGVGKERTAFALACAIGCTVAPGEGCGACATCHRMTSFSSEGARVPLHPDVVLVARGLYPKEVLGRSTEEKTELTVDQIRRVVLDRVHVSPHEAPQRVVIVRACEEMNASAANALLKTLEEPPRHTRFVLLTSKPGELLPTIRSRTQLVRFAPLSDATIEHLLLVQGVDLERARRIAPLAAGSMATALALADPKEADARNAAVEQLRAAAEGPLDAALDYTNKVTNTGESRARMLENLAALAAEEAGEVRRLVLAGAPEREIARALARRDGAVALAESLDRNANVPLALEAVWLQVRRT